MSEMQVKESRSSSGASKDASAVHSLPQWARCWTSGFGGGQADMVTVSSLNSEQGPCMFYSPLQPVQWWAYDQYLVKVCYLIEHTLSFACSLENSRNSLLRAGNYYQSLSFFKGSDLGQELQPKPKPRFWSRGQSKPSPREATPWNYSFCFVKTRHCLKSTVCLLFLPGPVFLPPSYRN